MISKINSSYSEKTAQKQLTLGEKYLSELEYKKAIVAFNKVIEIEPRNIKAYLGLSEAYNGLNQPDEVIRVLEDAVKVIVNTIAYNGEIPDNSEEIYLKLVDIYENNGDRNKAFRIIKEGYEILGTEKLTNAIKKYYPEVLVSIPSGNYTTPQTLKLISEGKRIYYTLNGSEPVKESEVYTGEILLDKGSFTLKAVAENKFGELGKVSIYSYIIEEVNEFYVAEEASNQGPAIIDGPSIWQLDKPTTSSTKIPIATPSNEAVPQRTLPEEDEVIVWKDVKFEKEIREILNKPSGDIYKSDVVEITELDLAYLAIDKIDDIVHFNLTYLDLSGNDIRDISVLNELNNLTFLNLGDSQISDISALRNLTNLTILRLCENQISDISFLSELTNLTILGLGENQISDISALRNLTNLTLLGINENQISDISALSNLTNLTCLYLNANQTSDINALRNLTTLAELDLRENDISDISALSNLTNLTSLCLSENQISDISALGNLTNLTYLSLMGNEIIDISALGNLTNLTYLSLMGNEIIDISALSNLTNLTELRLMENNISDISALSNLTNLTFLCLRKNQIRDISTLSYLTNLTWICLDANQISDISALGNLTNLTYLSLMGNEIIDISTLSNLTNLTELLLFGNKIRDWSPVSHVFNVLGR
jgi:internalin A